jgi:hypothetical protein
MRAVHKAAPSIPGARVSLGQDNGSVQLTPTECRELYILLGEDAPFVRNQLSVIRNGGEIGVTVTTPDEHREVLAALRTGRLSDGLRLLKTALSELAKPT